MKPPHSSLSSLTRRTGLLAAAGAVLSGCSGAQVLDKLVPDRGYTVRTGVAYGADPRQQLDVYLPATDGAMATQGGPGGQGRKPPLIVFLYGGTWSHGRREDYRFVGQALAARGNVVLVADRRLAPTVRYPAFVQDGAAVVRWAVDHTTELGADPARTILMGHSSGAYDAAMLALDPRWLGAVGLQPRRIAAWIGMAGPYDFLPIGDPDAQAAFDWPNTSPDSQPINHVTAQAPRTLLMVGMDDKLVDPRRNTLAMAEKLRAAGVDTTLHTYPTMGHVTLISSVAAPLHWLGPVRDDLLAFIATV